VKTFKHHKKGNVADEYGKFHIEKEGRRE